MVRFWSVLLFCAVACIATAQDRWRSDTALRVIPQLEPKNQIAIGIGFPVGEPDGTSASNQISIQYFRYLADIFAFKAELGYTHNTSAVPTNIS